LARVRDEFFSPLRFLFTTAQPPRKLLIISC